MDDKDRKLLQKIGKQLSKIEKENKELKNEIKSLKEKPQDAKELDMFAEDVRNAIDIGFLSDRVMTTSEKRLRASMLVAEIKDLCKELEVDHVHITYHRNPAHDF